VRQFLLALFALAFFIAACVWGPAVARLPILWLCLANVGLVGAIMLVWCVVARPDEVRAKRRDQGLCVTCGYDPRGNITDVCPECGRSERDNQTVHDWP
jgi:hypothetical protein